MTGIFDMAVPRTRLRIIKWVGAALASLLAFLLMAGAYWYVAGVRVADDPYVDVGAGGISTVLSGIVTDVDVGRASSSCVRSPRSRLSARAIVGRPESRRGDLHLAALHPSPGAMSAGLDDKWRILPLGVAPRVDRLQQARGY